MGVTRFQSQVDVGSSGGQDVDKLAASFEKLAGSIEGATAKGDKLAQHPGFDDFARKVKAGIQDPLGAAGDAMEALMQGMGPMGTAVSAGVGIFTAFGAATFEAAKSLGEYGTQIHNISLRTGLTTKEVGQFSFAAAAAGQDVGVFESAMRKLSQGLDENSEEGKKARSGLADLGVSAFDSSGKLRPMSDIFIQISEGLNKIEEPAKRNVEALKIFGRAGIELIPTILGLSENIERARELGLGPSDAEIARWEEYHKQIAEAEARWDSFARKLKEPLAAIFSISLHGLLGDDSDITGPALKALTGQVGKILPEEAVRRLDLLAASADVSKEQYDKILDQINKAADKNLFGNKPLVLSGGDFAGFAPGLKLDTSKLGRPALLDTSALYRPITSALDPMGGEHADLAAAKKELTDLQGKLRTKQELKAPYQELLAAADDVQRQKALVAGIEAQEKATKALEAAKERVAELDKHTAEYVLKATDADNSPIGKYNAERGKLLMEELDALRKVGTNEDLRARIRDDYDAMFAALTAEFHRKFEEYLDKEIKEADAYAAVGQALLLKKAEKASKDFTEDNQLILNRYVRPEPPGYKSPERQLRDAQDNERRGIGIYSGQAGLANVSEIGQITVMAELRKGYADDELKAALRIAEQHGNEAAKQDALDQKQQKYLDAEIEKQQALIQLALRQKQEFQSLVVGGVEALIHGQGTSFLKQTGTGIFDKVLSNAAGMVWKDFEKFIPHAGDPNSTTGKLLQGTMFGADPLKFATDLNTKATDANTAALTEWLRVQETSSAGGGSFGRLPGIFTKSGSGIPDVSSSISYGGGGYSETDPSTYGLPTDGSPGDYGGEYSGASAGKYDSVIGGVGISKAGGSNVGRYGMYAGALLAGGFGAYSGFKAGGAQGALTGVGSITGAAAVLDPEPISKAILMGIAMGSGLVSLVLGDPKQNRDLAESKALENARYTAPTAANYTRDRYGRSYDSDTAGNIRPIQVTFNVQALDAKSLVDRSGDIAAALTVALEAKSSPRLSMALRNVTFQR
jgi:hypothetical protein